MAARGGHWSKDSGGNRVFIPRRGGSAGYVAAREAGQRYKMWKQSDGYALADTKVRDAAGISKIVASGTRAEVTKALRRRVETARTRAVQKRQERLRMMRDDAARGFYSGIPLTSLRGDERRIVAAQRRRTEQ